MSLPQVAIVGRPNVGKSSLMNMLVGKRVSIVEPTAGVTRDRVTSELELPPARSGGEPRYCELVDTGGYGVYAGDDELCVLTDDIEYQIQAAFNEAQLILFVVDAQSGITPLDKQVAKLLREQVSDPSRILLVENKVDHESHEADAYEGHQLGLGDPVFVSATTKYGKFDLLHAITDKIDFDTVFEKPVRSEMHLAIVGRRNAGKSTLVNALAGQERVIASELAGTTRDSIDVRFQMDDHVFTAIDTAGVRKRKSFENDVEYYSYHRALRAIRRADVVLFLIDARLRVSQVDKKLSSEIAKHYKPCVIVINKWDLVEDQVTTEDYIEYLGDAIRGLDYAPIVFISAKDNDCVREAVETAMELYEQSGARVSTSELNETLQEILAMRGPSSKLGKQAKIYYATMPTVHPPTIVLFVNYPELFDNRYQRYMINRFRERMPFKEVPIKLIIRPRRRIDLDAVAQS